MIDKMDPKIEAAEEVLFPKLVPDPIHHNISLAALIDLLLGEKNDFMEEASDSWELNENHK